MKRLITHTLEIKVEAEIPDTCPSCGCDFRNPNAANLLVIHSVDQYSNTRITDNNIGMLYSELPCGLGREYGYRCANCEYVLAPSHNRTYILAEMDDLAKQLKTLLYDENVLDEVIRKKVFG